VIALEEKMQIASVTIKPTEDCWGSVLRKNRSRVRMDIENDQRKIERYLTREIRVMLAGLAAEWRFTGRNNFQGASSDFKNALDVASHVYGPQSLGPYLNFMAALMKDVISGPATWCRVKAVADALLERETITGRDVRYIYREAVANEILMQQAYRESQECWNATD
jgi:hypothetical protein